MLKEPVNFEIEDKLFSEVVAELSQQYSEAIECIFMSDFDLRPKPDRSLSGCVAKTEAGDKVRRSSLKALTLSSKQNLLTCATSEPTREVPNSA